MRFESRQPVSTLGNEPATVSSPMDQFEAGLEALKQSPPNNSKVVVSIIEATQKSLADPSFPEFKDTIETFVANRYDDVDREGVALVQLFWRGAQYMVAKKDEQYNPENYQHPLPWQIFFKSILTADRPGKLEETGIEFTEEVLGMLHVQTTEPQRYLGVKLALDAFSDVLPANPTYVDAGCSARFGMVHLGENMEFAPLTVHTTDKGIKRKVHSSLLGSCALSKVNGFDKVVGTSVNWVNACQYPEEFANADRIQKRKEYDEILRAKRDVYRYRHADLTEGAAGMGSVLGLNDGKPYDVAGALTTLYMAPKRKLPAAFKALDAVSSQLEIVADFATINRKDPTKLSFPHSNINGRQFIYKLFARLRQENRQRWLHLATFNNGRCTEMIPEPDLIALYRKRDA